MILCLWVRPAWPHPCLCFRLPSSESDIGKYVCAGSGAPNPVNVAYDGAKSFANLSSVYDEPATVYASGKNDQDRKRSLKLIMKLEKHEKDLVGKWTVQGARVLADATCERIAWLVDNCLNRIAVNKQCGDWETLYQDPDDGRYWERTFPQGEMQGGGPPQLTVMSEEAARTKYDLSK